MQSQLSAKISEISRASVYYNGSHSTNVYCSLTCFISFVSYQQCPLSNRSVENHPKDSEEPSSDSNLFRDFTNTAYHLLTTLRLLPGETTFEDLRAIFVGKFSPLA